MRNSHLVLPETSPCTFLRWRQCPRWRVSGRCFARWLLSHPPRAAKVKQNKQIHTEIWSTSYTSRETNFTHRLGVQVHLWRLPGRSQVSSLASRNPATGRVINQRRAHVRFTLWDCCKRTQTETFSCFNHLHFIQKNKSWKHANEEMVVPEGRGMGLEKREVSWGTGLCMSVPGEVGMGCNSPVDDSWDPRTRGVWGPSLAAI